MKEPYGKGLATHPGPESCAGHGNMAGEALTRAHGWVALWKWHTTSAPFVSAIPPSMPAPFGESIRRPGRSLPPLDPGQPLSVPVS
jgi:hypothetical protein